MSTAPEINEFGQLITHKVNDSIEADGGVVYWLRGIAKQNALILKQLKQIKNNTQRN